MIWNHRFVLLFILCFIPHSLTLVREISNTKDKLQNKHKKIKCTVYERKSTPNAVFFSLYFHLLMYHYTSFVDLSVYNLSKLMHRTCLHIKTESSLEHLGTVLLATVTLINGNSVSTESTFALTRSPELARCCVYTVLADY